MKNLVSFLAITILALGSFSHSGRAQPDQQIAESAQSADEALEETSKKALGALKDKDFGVLSTLVHPEKGVRFTPYAFIDAEEDVVLNAGEIKGILADRRSYSWGSYAGSGESIDLPFREYFQQFVWDHDFSDAEMSGKNNVFGRGNALNLKEVYPDAQFFEYHFSGFDPQYDGMDWVSLRLVFEEQNGKWYVVGIIHDQWTP